MFLTGIIIYVIDENKQNNLNNVKHKLIKKKYISYCNNKK